MHGILHNYAIGSKRSWAVRVVVPVFIFLTVLIGDEFTAWNLFTLLTLGIWVNMGVNTRLRRFYMVMPITPKVFVLSDYLHNAFAILVSSAIAIVMALIKFDNKSAAIMFILFVIGLYLVMCASESFARYIFGNRWYLGAFILWALAIGLPYLIFGVETIHQFGRNIMAREPAHEAEIFANTSRMLIFATTSACLYVLSYFTALAAHKRNDFVDMKWWM